MFFRILYSRLFLLASIVYKKEAAYNFCFPVCIICFFYSSLTALIFFIFISAFIYLTLICLRESVYLPCVAALLGSVDFSLNMWSFHLSFLQKMYSAPLSLSFSFGTLLRVVYIVASHRRSAPHHHHPHFFFSLFFRLMISIHLSSNSLAFPPSVQPAVKDIEWIFKICML